MKTGDLILYGGIAIAGYALYQHFKKSSAVPALVVTGWLNGNASWQLGTAKGTLTPSGAGKVAATGPFGIQVNDWDGAGYDILVLQGQNVVNSLYVDGNGSFT